MIADRMQVNLLLHVTDRLKEAKGLAAELDEETCPFSSRIEAALRAVWQQDHRHRSEMNAKEIELLEWFVELIDDNASEVPQ